MVEIKYGKIYHNGSEIGYYTNVNNTLYDIFIESNYRGNRYSEEAIDIMCENIKSQGYDVFRVVDVISDKMEKILKECGFTRAKNMSQYNNINVENQNIESNNTWIKRL